MTALTTPKDKLSVRNYKGIPKIKVGYISRPHKRERIQIKKSQDAYDVFYHNWDRFTLSFREELNVLFLTKSSHIICFYNAFSGGVSGTVVDAKVIFAAALRVRASSIIIAHNHPSGSIIPSAADKTLTEKIKRGAKCLDMLLLDHLILTPTKGKYLSFADEGYVD